jgi:hypothetical protein
MFYLAPREAAASQEVISASSRPIALFVPLRSLRVLSALIYGRVNCRIASWGCRPFAVVLQIMPYKFLRGDTVRRTGTQEPLVVGETEAGGLRYTLKDSRGIGYTIEWTPEEQLELVKRASDDETGLSAFYIS